MTRDELVKAVAQRVWEHCEKRCPEENGCWVSCDECCKREATAIVDLVESCKEGEA